MTDQEKRIKLAEAMGWKQIAKRRLASRSLKRYWLTGRSPDQKTGRWGVKQIPDPYTDANDCNALIKHLNGLGWDVILDLSCSARAVVKIGSNRVPWMVWRGNNWMRGVCELALKVTE